MKGSPPPPHERRYVLVGTTRWPDISEIEKKQNETMRTKIVKYTSSFPRDIHSVSQARQEVQSRSSVLRTSLLVEAHFNLCNIANRWLTYKCQQVISI